jgi:hypothetical protein
MMQAVGKALSELTPAVMALALATGCSQQSQAERDSIGTAPPLEFDFTAVRHGQARCHVVVDPNAGGLSDGVRLSDRHWITVMDGPCRYYFDRIANMPSDAGTLVLYEMGPQAQINAAGDYVSGYFVYVMFQDRAFITADSSWNGARNVDRAHTHLGSAPETALRREGPCWVNERARVCISA